MKPTVEGVTALLKDVQSVDKEQVQQALNIAEAVVEAHTRGVARTADGAYRAGCGEIVTALAARITANPTGGSFQDSAGTYSRSRGAGVRGLLLHERIVLDRYRKSATAR